MGIYDFTLYEIVKRNAMILPNNTAFVWEDLRITHEQYLQRVDRLASGLDQWGIKKGDRIAVLAQNAMEYMDLYGAAAKIGAIMLPINWRLNAEEVQYILTDGEPKIAVIGTEYQELIRKVSGKVGSIQKIFLLEDGEGDFPPLSELSSSSNETTGADIKADDPYLIIHTAAVGGKPRGATLSQGNLIASNIQGIATMGITERDVYLQLLPLFHIAGLSASITVLHAGGKNVIMRKFDAETALGLIEKEKVTFFSDFPPILSMLYEKANEKSYDLSSLANITYLLEDPKNILKFKEKFPARFWTGYGQSETSGFVTVGLFSEEPGYAGKPALLADVLLVDEYDRPVERGKPGEITVRGPLVFKGYWNLKRETDYTFREGWHHTGDIGRMDEVGNLFYVKRKGEKELIKPGGENVYPAEVEKVILEHPDVEEVSVIGVPDPEWGEAIKAVCVLKAGAAISEKDLIDFVASKIARYKKPKYVQYVETLPKTEDGSVDREKIKAQYGGAQS